LKSIIPRIFGDTFYKFRCRVCVVSQNGVSIFSPEDNEEYIFARGGNGGGSGSGTPAGKGKGKGKGTTVEEEYKRLPIKW
jgi:hypothetical protein